MATTNVCIVSNIILPSPLGRAPPLVVETVKPRSPSVLLTNAASAGFPSVSPLTQKQCQIHQRARYSVSALLSQGKNKTSEASDDKEKFIVTKSEPVLVVPIAKTFNGLYFLSTVDQTLPVLTPYLFCFEADEMKRNKNSCEIIKQALAKVLVHFYPLAGSFTLGSDGRYMEKCTGEGVPFIKADANCELHEWGDFTIPNPTKHLQLVHNYDVTRDILDVPLLTVQVTMFKCGGVVLGLTMNHSMCDGISTMEFMKSWAETARGLSLSVPPFLDRSILKPRQTQKIDESIHHILKPRQTQKIDESIHHMLSTEYYNPSTILAHNRDEDTVDRSFCFDSEKLMQLKRMAMEDHTVKSPTNFELLTAFVWQLRTEALNLGPHEPTKVFITVDFRPKFGPSFPQGYFGNAVVPTMSQCSVKELIEKPFSFAVKKVQEAVALVTEDYVHSVYQYMEETRKTISMENAFITTKWSRLPFYDADFGWGGPKQLVHQASSRFVLMLHQGKDKRDTVLALGLPSLAMKAFEELMQTRMGIQ